MLKAQTTDNNLTPGSVTALTFPPGSRPGPPQLGLHALTPPLQQLDVPPTTAHLQPQHRAAVLHPPVHLRHGRLGQDFQDGQQLALEAAVLHVQQLLSQNK